MAITAAGVGSGLDINGIVTQLMLLESAPVRKLESQVDDYEAQLSAYGKIRSALSSFESAMEGLGSLDKFKVYSASSSDEDVLTASASSVAANGTYNIEISRLAQRHKMASDEYADTATFSGSLSIAIGTDSLTINPVDNSLEEIRDLINNDANNPGVTATIINVDAGLQRLVLTSEEEGSANQLVLSGTLDDPANPDNPDFLGLASINQVPVVGGGGEITYETITNLADLDASFTVDGFEITSSSNSASNVVDGITFELQEIGSATLSLSRDTDKITENVKEFIDSYNDVQKLLNDYSSDELRGDSTLRSMQSQLRNVLNTAPTGLTGSFNFLSQIGILSDAKTGELSVDEADLERALDVDFQSVADLFANNDQGFAFRFAEVADRLLDNGNVINTREEGLRSRKSGAERNILSLEARLELKETALRAKFASLDALIGSMQSTMSFLTRF